MGPTPLCDLDKAVVQLLLSKGIFSDSSVKDAITRLRIDYPDPAVDPRDTNPYTLKQLQIMLQRINKSIRLFGLEARTVLRRVPSNSIQPSSSSSSSASASQAAPTTIDEYWHGIANVEEDSLAKELGSDSSAKEIALFNAMLHHLAEVKVMTHYEVEELVKGQRAGAGAGARDEEGSGQEERKEPATQGVQALKFSKSSELTSALAKLESGGWLTRSGARGYWELGMRTFLELKPVVTAVRARSRVAGGEEEEEEEDADVPHVIVY